MNYGRRGRSTRIQRNDCLYLLYLSPVLLLHSQYFHLQQNKAFVCAETSNGFICHFVVSGQSAFATCDPALPFYRCHTRVRMCDLFI